MNANNRPARGWSLILVNVGLVFLLMACSAVGTGIQTNDDGSIQVQDGTIEVQNEDGEWVPIAGESAFELVGELESTEPWTVAGTPLETNEATQIEEGLQVGDLVWVLGTVLEDGTWLAYSIQSAEEQTDPNIILIGVVDSVDPWVVNGIELNVTDETDVQGDIESGMIVRAEVLVLSDGTWEVLSIAPLGASIETSGCVTVVATIVSVDGNVVQFLGWPTTVQLSDDVQNTDDAEDEQGDEGETEGVEALSAGQVVQAVICISEAGQLVILQITVLEDEDNNDGDTSDQGEKVLVCHKPEKKKGGHTISIAAPAVPAHLGHGDTLGPCP
ncbi:MAG TPA: DUF5666 domain-containing protein [Anaerolineales bacterium]|nr:DUF5666 domain-containing protein [Anaerolineales bacterium]